MRLQIEQSNSGSVVQVTVRGVLDWSTVPQFRDVMRTLASSNHRLVRLDMSGLISWSPDAQQVVRRSVARARRRGQDVVVSGLSSITRWEAEGCPLPDPQAPPGPGRYRYRRSDGTPGPQVASTATGGQLRLVRVTPS